MTLKGSYPTQEIRPLRGRPRWPWKAQILPTLPMLQLWPWKGHILFTFTIRLPLSDPRRGRIFPPSLQIQILRIILYFILPQKHQKFIRITTMGMMLFLIQHIFHYSVHTPLTKCECSKTFLPSKCKTREFLFFDEGICWLLDFTNKIRDTATWFISNYNMNMIGHSIYC